MQIEVTWQRTFIGWKNILCSPCFYSVNRKKIDLNREPQVIYEARCQDSHSGGSCNSALGLEIIPVTLRMPVLRKNSACFPLPSYSVEFENITVACICALARTQEEIAQGWSQTSGNLCSVKKKMWHLWLVRTISSKTLCSSVRQSTFSRYLQIN